MKLAAIILTLNEEMHIERCISSVNQLVDKVYVVDAYSTDSTVETAQNLGAIVMQNKWKNHADQFNWALKNIEDEIDWVIRIDADEYLSDDLKREISVQLPKVKRDVVGVLIKRKIIFQGRLVRFGGIGSVDALRLMKMGHGYCEARFMDEHLVVDGKVERFSGCIYDDNINGLGWWIGKHNSYASKEAIEALNIKYGFIERKNINKYSLSTNANIKRILKEKIYYKVPPRFRATLYYFVRNILLGGYIDAIFGNKFHYLQGYWYRLLVDLKIYEIERYKDAHKVDIISAIQYVTGEKVIDEDIDSNNC